jgi:tape measure domain-containing protein
MAVQKDRYQLEIETRQAAASLGKLSTLMKGFAGVIAIRELVQFGGAIVNATKTMQTLENQLRLVTTSSAELDRLLQTLRKTAIDNRTAFDATVELFVKLRVATEELGISEERIIAVTSKLSQALQVAGADAATTNSVIRQFSQAMASGTVRGDEFNSLVEGLGPALAIMARESGITVGELRRMSQEGELTAERMFKMLEASNSLTTAFQQMQPTLESLETRFSDTFDAFLIKLGEATGVTEGYENALKRLTRLMEDFADVEGSLTDMAPGDIFAKAREGAISLDAAIYELSERLRNDNWTLGLSLSDEEEKAIEGIITQLQFLKIEQSAAANESQKVAETQKKQKDALNALLAPHKRFIDQAKEFAATDYRTELEKANQRVIDAEIVIEQLHLAFKRSNGEIDNFVGLLRGAQNELDDAKEKLAKLREEANKPVGFDKFYKDLLVDSKEIVDNAEYIRQAQVKLFRDLQAGTITLEQYTEALQILNEKQKAIFGDFELFSDNVNDFVNNMVSGTDDLRQELATLNMDPLEKQLSDIEDTLNRDMQRQLTELTEEMTKLGGDPNTLARLQELKQRVREATQAQIEQQQTLARQIYETQRSFEYGWGEAFKQYEDDATNAAKKAEEVFTKATKGMEDALVDFAKTGKFEWRNLIADMLETLLRSQIQQLMLSIFKLPTSSGNALGNLGSLFSGFFANGGFIPGGTFGVVGERGPELVTGPANVTPLQATPNVTYNINAVDALSFRQLVARDPGFIHAVAMKGGSAIPSGR